MVDNTIRIDFEQESKTAIGRARATTTNFYFLNGFMLSTLLANEKDFNNCIDKAISKIIHNGYSMFCTPCLEVKTCNDNNATGKLIFRVSIDDTGLYMIDFRNNLPDKEYTKKKTALTMISDYYYNAMLTANE